MYDVIIIGAGVVGSAVAREISRYVAKIAVLEKENDVCEGTSKANSGIVHAGFDAEPGSLKAKLNLSGNVNMEKLSKELDFSFRQNGSLVVCEREEDIKKLEELKQRGIQNGVAKLRILNREEIKKIEPNISDSVVAALYAPTGGIVCPFNLTIALAENACQNGVEFYMGTEVKTIEKMNGFFKIITENAIFESRVVVNAAGIYADKLHNMVSENHMMITARKGEYCLLDKKAKKLVNSTIFQLPTPMGKGVLVTPTVHGNILIGPTAMDTQDKEGTNTTQKGLDEVFFKAARSVCGISTRLAITSFSGLRAHVVSDDFIIAEVEDAKGFIDVAGIESPGLTCAPAIGEYVANLIWEMLKFEKKVNFESKRIGITDISESSDEEKSSLIRKNKAYATVICRCELVTEGEILEAIHRPLGATTLDGVKRRTRAGMGRCQAGFCSPKVVEILARELGVDIGAITKSGTRSTILTGYNKEGQDRTYES